MRVELSAKAEEDLARIYDFNLERSVEWAQRVNQRLLERSLPRRSWAGLTVRRACGKCR